MVNALLAEDDAALTGAKPVRTIYDPACGTGGMLTVAQDHLRRLNPRRGASGVRPGAQP